MTASMAQPDEPPVSQAVASEIRAAMARRGLTQTSLAARMGRDKVWINRRLAPRLGPRTVSISFDDLEEFARALSVPWWQLLPRLDSNQQPFGKPSSSRMSHPQAIARRYGARRGHLRAVRAAA